MFKPSTPFDRSSYAIHYSMYASTGTKLRMLMKEALCIAYNIKEPFLLSVLLGLEHKHLIPDDTIKGNLIGYHV